jgi:hypothetical protein
MNQAPVFGRSSRIAIGKEAISDEDRRGIYCVMPSSISENEFFSESCLEKC